MANDLKAFRIAARDDRHGGISGDLVREVHELAVNLAGKRSLGETGTDRGGDFADRHGIGIFALGTVWKSDYYHFLNPHKNCGHKKSADLSRTFFCFESADNNAPTPDLNDGALLFAKPSDLTASSAIPKNFLVGTIGFEPTTPTMSR